MDNDSILDITYKNAAWSLSILRGSMNLYKGEGFEFHRFLVGGTYTYLGTSEDEILETMANQFAEDGNGQSPAEYIQNWENNCGHIYHDARTSPTGKAAIAHVRAMFTKALERFPAEALED